MLIEHDDKQHLFAAALQLQAETRNFLACIPGDCEAVALLAQLDIVVERINAAKRGSRGHRQA